MTTPSDPPEAKTASPHSDPVLGPYFQQLLKALEGEKDQKQTALLFARRMGSEYFLTILQIIYEIDRLCREMQSVVGEFTGRNVPLGRFLTIEYLATSMKLYVISWSTLLDLLAYFVNAVFSLGIADRDVRLHLVLGNSRVASSRIPEIFRQYNKTSLIKDLKKKRNDLIHRGGIPDTDVGQILKERNRIDSRRYSLLQLNPISEEEHKEQVHLLQNKLTALAKDKQEVFGKHHQQTLAMISEIAREVAPKTIVVLKATDLHEKSAVQVPQAT